MANQEENPKRISMMGWDHPRPQRVKLTLQEKGYPSFMEAGEALWILIIGVGCIAFLLWLI